MRPVYGSFPSTLFGCVHAMAPASDATVEATIKYLPTTASTSRAAQTHNTDSRQLQRHIKLLAVRSG